MCILSAVSEAPCAEAARAPAACDSKASIEVVEGDVTSRTSGDQQLFDGFLSFPHLLLQLLYPLQTLNFCLQSSLHLRFQFHRQILLCYLENCFEMHVEQLSREDLSEVRFIKGMWAAEMRALDMPSSCNDDSHLLPDLTFHVRCQAMLAREMIFHAQDPVLSPASPSALLTPHDAAISHFCSGVEVEYLREEQISLDHGRLHALRRVSHHEAGDEVVDR
mmetsp:Transcript_30655/g.98651  ORF Transcript_30655/g.98651 Transcript_30655/m.98651 type:complete len:220 (+) Transcript_30655:275-934(+)